MGTDFVSAFFVNSAVVYVINISLHWSERPDSGRGLGDGYDSKFKRHGVLLRFLIFFPFRPLVWAQ